MVLLVFHEILSRHLLTVHQARATNKLAASLALSEVGPTALLCGAAIPVNLSPC